MKKKTTSKTPYKYKIDDDEMPANKVSETQAPYYISSPQYTQPGVDEFTFNKFQRIADKIPFTQREWAQILHLSERTLQRYAAGNTPFEGIYTDKILHIQQLLELGLETFSGADALYSWLKKEKNAMGHTLSFNALYSTSGIQALIDQLTRIQYGIYT
jgi:uncharacterized protein (DUF2384 family)